MNGYYRSLVEAFSSLVFPPICLHCRASVERGRAHFCRSCFEWLTLLPVEGRCRGCFEEFDNASSVLCSGCRNQPSSFTAVAAALEYEGPAKTWVHALKYRQQPYLAKSAGAFLLAQFLHLQWPVPDLIVPVPISWSHWWQRGYNQTELLSQGIGTELRRPVLTALKKSLGYPRQAGLDYHQRKQMTRDCFQLRVPPSEVEDKTILLIDDVMTTGSTLKRCGEVLWGGHPKRVYALALCKTFLTF